MKKSLFLILMLLLSACSGGQALSTPTSPPTATATLAPTATSITTAVAQPSATAQPQPSMTATAEQTAFNGARAFQDVEAQMALGPRVPGSPAHAQVIAWMQKELAASGWSVEVQETTRMGHPIRNVIAKRGSGTPWTIIGAHFDSRMKADQDADPAKHDQPVPAANDGASGVAVLTELARVLPKDLPGQVWLALFDAEDQGDLPGWDWILGSRALADSLQSKPDAVIVIDMIGDANLNIYEEQNSDKALTAQIWATAARLGYEQQFISQVQYSMLDDHTPFLEKGIPAVDIIDFDYPYWHTTQDTADKVSPHSLKVVGDVLLTWLESKR